MNEYTERSTAANTENRENTMNQTNTEIQTQPATLRQAATRKPRMSREAKLNALRKHIEARLSFEEIQRAINLSQAELALLYFELSQIDGRWYEITYTRRVKNVKVGTKGNFQISADNIARMGLDSIFTAGTVVSFRRDGDTIVASVVANAASEADTENSSLDILEDLPETPDNGLEEDGCGTEEEPVYMSAEEYRRLTGQKPPKVAVLEREVA